MAEEDVAAQGRQPFSVLLSVAALPGGAAMAAAPPLKPAAGPPEVDWERRGHRRRRVRAAWAGALAALRWPRPRRLATPPTSPAHPRRLDKTKFLVYGAGIFSVRFAGGPRRWRNVGVAARAARDVHRRRSPGNC